MVRIARALADQTRVRILIRLLDGAATVSALVVDLGLVQPRVSAHLAALRRAGIVHVDRDGRQRTYGVEVARVSALLGALAGAAPAASALPARSTAAARVVRQDAPIRRARTCYDHLAGVTGVALLDQAIERRWLTAVAGARPTYALTGDGATALAQRGVDLDAVRRSRRLFAPGCLDWTERRSHLGGALGAALLAALQAGAVVERQPGSRILRQRAPLDRWLAGPPPV
jgi:DNA-binding transcriptional ArsR family regulator